jgi:peptidoglycan/xylan/chitin deacetylase (PgdA/CDA1 family)
MLARWWTQRSTSSLTILYYHQASRGNLRSHWQYLRRHYRILPLETALEELRIPLKKAVQSKDRRSLLAVTFDDGYYDNYTHAFSLACELQLPITIFLIPGHMESGNSFWWTTRLLRLAQVDWITFAEHSYNLNLQEERKTLAQAIDIRFSSCTSPIEREKLLASLYTLLAIPSSITLKEQPVPLLGWEQVCEMQASGWISFGAHTMHHPDLGNLADPAEVQQEVAACRTLLSQRLGHSIHTFAYPFGSIGTFGASAVKQAGYDWAVTTQPGVNTCQSDPYLLKRRNMDGGKHWLVVAAETAGIWGFFSYLKKSSRLLIRTYSRGRSKPSA